MRGASQVEPKPTEVVTLSGPFGRSLFSFSIASVMASLAKISLAVRNRSSPCSVRMRPRAWRWNSGTVRLSSSPLICRLTADWLRFSASPAWVKLPASATARNTRSLSQSMADPPVPRISSPSASLFGSGACFVMGEELLRLERAHAAHAGGGHGLTKDLVLDVAGREDAGDVGRRRIRRRHDIALAVHA